MYYFAFNNTNGPAADNLKLRQAIAYAINREDLYLATGDEGASPATSFWGWHMKYYFDEFDLDLSYNPEKAKELVAEIGACTIMHELGLETDKTFRNTAAYIQSWLKALQNDKRMIVSAAGKAEKAVNRIFERESA